jgi:hypothetical protein
MYSTDGWHSYDYPSDILLGLNEMHPLSLVASSLVKN